MPIRRVLHWMLPPLALVGLVAWFASTSTPIAKQAEKTPTPPLVGMLPAPQPPRAAGPDSLAAVEKFVAQKNSEGEAQKFVKAGWHIDDAPPPDPKLLALDPSLLKSREA